MELTITKDNQELERLEGIINRNLQSFYEVGRALMEIKDKELYKLKNVGAYHTFEQYCKGVWDMGRRNTYYLMDAVTVVENVQRVSQNSEDKIPSSLRQTIPLARLEPDQQREAWQKAVETAPEGKVTAAHVSKVVREMTTTEEKQTPIPTDDSLNLSNIKTMWNACNSREKQKFIDWIAEYFGNILNKRKAA